MAETSIHMIPNEAVDAAVKASYLRHDWSEYNRRFIERALEAAAPHLTERAYNAGHLDGMNGAPNTNPYRSSE